MRYTIYILPICTRHYWTRIQNCGIQVHLSLYEALEKEKTEQKKVQKDNPKILLFQMFCAENYRETKNISAKETLLLFSNHGVFEFLYENFEMLHTQDTEYILDTIITYINKKA